MQSKVIPPTTRTSGHLGVENRSSDLARTFQLQNQLLRSEVSLTGSGGVFLGDEFLGDVAVTRWCGDRTADAEGYFVYLRDLDSGEFWSAGYQPTLKVPDQYEVQSKGSAIEFSRRDGSVVTTFTVCLAKDDPVELRYCQVTNQGDTPLRLELTSYAELVLQDPAADAAHPAFSKLFVETSVEQSKFLIARRRKRQSDQADMAAVHFLAGDCFGTFDQFETDRRRFVGRGQDLSRPVALQSANPLSGSRGSVLDPVFSLRKILYLPPHESACVTFGLAASQYFPKLEEVASRYADQKFVDQVLRQSIESEHKSQNFTLGNTDRRIDAAVGSVAKNGDTKFFLPAVPPPRADKKNGSVGRRSADSPSNANGDPQTDEEQLQFDNGWGGFSADGTEYVIRLQPPQPGVENRPPLPWVNVIANPNFGFLVSESGAGFTWAGNSRLNRLTPWYNDPVCDPHSEALYLRDEETRAFWSPLPGPAVSQSSYEVRHGFGYTRCLHTSHDLQQEVVQFVPRNDAVKVTHIRVRNQSDRSRRLSLFAFNHWELGDGGSRKESTIQTEIQPEQRAVFATNHDRGEFSDQVAYAAFLSVGLTCQQSYSGDRKEFLGSNGRLAEPLALRSTATLSGNFGNEFDPCAACCATFELAPGETLEYVVLLGETASREEARRVISRHQTARQCRQALADVQEFWREKLSAVQIKTPSSAIDLLVNGWLPYQNLSCRLWGRSSFYQSGGAFGFRDQLQDASAWLLQWPELTRQQILLNAAHQFTEGDVLHWWHPPASQGVRTKFSDDLLWLPLFAAEYVAATGDESLWQEQVRFLTSKPVPEGATELMVVPSDSGFSGSVYKHCCRALDRGLTEGRHGLPLMGCGDWNDGMNRVGAGGQGESVWLGFFIDYILGLMLPVCQQLGDQEGFERYSKYRTKLRTALNDAGWDGAWYRRAYFDDGAPLGTAAGEECQIDALVQAWAVLSGVAPPDRAAQAMSAAEQRLVDPHAGLIRLLDPPFDQMDHDPGYIKGYLPGIRENGGQYTHGVLWFIRAVAEQGRGSRAVELLEMLLPINHSRTPEEVNTYQTEPYVVAADVYSQAPHAGRGGWSWYTGSAGWMFRVAVESILGLRLKSGKTLIVDPRIRADWPEYRINYRLPDNKTSYEIVVKNPRGKQAGVTSARCDGKAVAVRDQAAEIPLQPDGAVHQVEIEL